MSTNPPPDPNYGSPENVTTPPTHPPGNPIHHPPGNYAPPPPGSGLAPNLAAALAYVTIIPAIIFLVLAPYNRDRLVRFHAWQSVILYVLWFVVNLVLRFIPFVGWIFWELIGLIFLIFILIAALKAFQGVEWKIPGIGDVAAQQAAKGAI